MVLFVHLLLLSFSEGMQQATEPQCEKPRLRVMLIRHSESMNNIYEAISEESYRANRSEDPEISERGKAQAKALGDWLATGDGLESLIGPKPINELWTSPFQRTLMTAEPVSKGLGLPAKVHTKIYEAGGIYKSNYDYTKFEARPGLSRNEMQRRFPHFELPDQVQEHGWYVGSGRESDDQARARAKVVAAELVQKAAGLTEDHTLCMVVHYDFICALLDALVLPHTVGPFDRWKSWNTGITVFDLQPPASLQEQPYVALLALNAIPHILAIGSGDLVSGFNIAGLRG
uniref:Phosphoglycerate mutase n=1 Tax=Aureoumbra lagunensis TaxID=44058 RepID=A0A7S3NEY7_9STRA